MIEPKKLDKNEVLDYSMIVHDFDGVLINSIDEVALTAYNAASGSLVTSLDELPGEALHLFRCNRFHVQPIGDAIPLMNWCISRSKVDRGKILTSNEYRAIILGCNVSLKDRTNLIYEHRTKFIEMDETSWLAIHAPYQPLWTALAERNYRPLVILTNKNRDATVRLCRHFGLRIEEHYIYSGDHGISKIENMREIRQRFGSDHYFFIDDSVKNLQDLDDYFNREQKIVFPLFASWGYVGPRDSAIAHQLGYRILNQEEFIIFLTEA
ncbi:MAG: HAD family hydrolase [Desulfobacterales bacterium]